MKKMKKKRAKKNQWVVLPTVRLELTLPYENQSLNLAP